MTPHMDLLLGLLDTSQPAELLSQPGNLLREIIYLVILAPTTPSSAFRLMRDFRVLEFPATEGLGSSFSPWEVCLGKGVWRRGRGDGGLWPLCLGFGLSPAGATEKFPHTGLSVKLKVSSWQFPIK